MTYAQKVDHAFERFDGALDAIPVLPREIIEQALELKDYPHDGRLGDVGDDLSEADRRLYSSRVAGGALARLAIGSHILADAGELSEGFFDLHTYDQIGVMDETVGLLDGRLDSGQDILPFIPHKIVRQQLHRVKAEEVTPSQRFKDIFAYWNVSPSSYEVRDRSIGRPDSLLVQAFGRNAIKDNELYLIRDSRLMRGNDIDTMIYLDNRQFDPGESNRELADIVDARLNEHEVVEPIIQWEVAYALWQKNPNKFLEYQNYLHLLWPRKNFYPTYEVKADSLEVMDELGMYNPLELAHQDMLVRSMAILAQLGIQADALDVDISYDPNSVQMQTRGITPMMIRELLARAEHVMRGRVAL